MNTVLAIITKEDEILIGKLYEDKAKDWGIEYSFPGGRVEEDENPQEAVIREAKEETNLEISVKSKIGERVHPKTEKLIEYFHCTYISGTESPDAAENDDIETLVWVKLEDLSKHMPTLFPAVKDYLDSLIK